MRVSYRRRRATTPAAAAESTRTNGTAKSNAAAGGAEGGTSAGIAISSVAVDERVSGLLSTMLHHAARLCARAQRPIGVLVNLHGSGLSGSHRTEWVGSRSRGSGRVCPTAGRHYPRTSSHSHCHVACCLATWRVASPRTRGSAGSSRWSRAERIASSSSCRTRNELACATQRHPLSILSILYNRVLPVAQRSVDCSRLQRVARFDSLPYRSAHVRRGARSRM